MFKIYQYFIFLPASLVWSPLAMGGLVQFFSQQRILTCYHISVVPIKIYPLQHGKFFHPSLLIFLFDWLMERWYITVGLLINCNGFYLLCHTNKKMHVNMSINAPAVKNIQAQNDVIAISWFKSQITNHGDFMFKLLHVLGLLFSNIATVKIIIKHLRQQAQLIEHPYNKYHL